MKPDTTLTLGDVTFVGAEIPEQLSFGGEQKLAIHELVGGARVMDALGRAEAPLTWQGRFLGQHALARARYLDSLRQAGQPLKLQWSVFAYCVVIRSLTIDYQRGYQLPYHITCEVLEDLTQPVKESASPGIDAWVREDMETAQGLIKGVEDGPLSALFIALKTAMRAVGHLAQAVQRVLHSVLQPLADLRARLSLLLRQVNALVHQTATLGGFLSASATPPLLAHLNALGQLSRLITLERVLGRLQANIGSVSSGARQITVAGGNLYALAAQEYGDANAWPIIAQANALTDPVLDGIHTLTIPPRP
jgi:hypothetical protein